MIPPFRSPLQVTECVQVPPLVFLDPTLVDVVNGDGVEVVQLFAPPADPRHEVGVLEGERIADAADSGRVS